MLLERRGTRTTLNETQEIMKENMLPDSYLFYAHSKGKIKGWINNLRYSYFNRACGGHANDGDYFSLALQYRSTEELLLILKQLGIKLSEVPEGNRKLVIGQSYRPQQWADVDPYITELPQYQQPCHTKIGGIECFCWIHAGQIQLAFSGHDGDMYEVSDGDFENCKKVEQLITSQGLVDKVSRSCEELVTCISKKMYGQLFE
jgi:hypothetical protein